MKKCLALLLTSALILCLAACSAKNEATATQAPAETETTVAMETSAATAAPTVTEAPAATEAVNPLLPTNEGVTLTIGLVQYTNVEDYKDNALTKWLEEQTGYNLEFVLLSADHAEAVTQLTAMMAGGEALPDILWGINGIEGERANKWGQDGYIIDLTPYFEDRDGVSKIFWDRLYSIFDETEINSDILPRAYCMEDGKYYTIPSCQVSGLDKVSNQCYINQQWLDKLGLKAPTNWEELVDVLRHFRDDDPNGNGIKDEIPLLGGTEVWRGDVVQWALNNFLYINDDNGFLFNVTDDGNLYYPQITEEYKEGLKAVKALVDEGLLPTIAWTIADSAEMKAIFNTEDGFPKVGILTAHATTSTVSDNDTFFQYTGLEPFNFAPLCGNNHRSSVCITADCKYPNEAFNLIMNMMTEEAAMRVRYGVPNEDWEFATSDEGDEGFVVLNSKAYGNTTRQTWNFVDGVITNFQQSPYTSIKAPGKEPSWSNKRGYITKPFMARYNEIAAERNPKYALFSPIYSADEAEENGDIETNLKQYIEAAKAEFINGTRDIDKDWDKYVSEFDVIGADTLLKNAQASFDRINK